MNFYRNITFSSKISLDFVKIIQQLLHSSKSLKKIKETIDNKKYGCGIFIDLRKAFDTVNHDILLKKLEHYGIRGNALKCSKMV